MLAVVKLVATTGKNFLEMLRIFARTDLKINTNAGDDFDNLILKPMKDLFNYGVSELNKYDFRNIEENYLDKNQFTIEDLIYIAEEVFFVTLEDGVKEDTDDNRKHIYEKIKSAKSLDNLSKTGLKSYYEGLGYENVRVKYDIGEESLKVYGDLDAYNTTTKTGTMVNGVVQLEDVSDDEKIIEIEEVKIVNESGSTVIFSKENIIKEIEKLTKKVGSTGLIKELINNMLDKFSSINGNIVTFTSPSISNGVITGADKKNSYEYLLKGFSSDLKDIEYISALCMSCIEIANNKINSLNSKSSQMNNAFSDISEFASEKYREIMVDKEVITKLNAAKSSVAEANEILGNYNKEIIKAQDAIKVLIEQVNSLPSEDEIAEFLNNLNIINRTLLEFKQ